MIRIAAVATLATLSLPAHATECWAVTGWTTTGAPGWSVPLSAIERPVLAPTDCSVTPSGYRWLHVTAYYTAQDPVPADFWVAAPHEDLTRGDRVELYHGLAWQGRYRGLPVLWRDGSGSDLPYELQSPTPAAPALGSVVVLRQQQSQDCVLNGTVTFSPYLLIDAWGLHCDEANPAGMWSSSAYEVTDAGTNGLGQQLVHLEHLVEGTCGYVGPWGGTQVLLHDDCQLGASGYDMTLEAVAGGYRIRSEDTGLCYGGANSGLSYTVHAVPCTDPAALYEVITLQRGSGGGASTLPPEPELPEEEM